MTDTEALPETAEPAPPAPGFRGLPKWAVIAGGVLIIACVGLIIATAFGFSAAGRAAADAAESRAGRIEIADQLREANQDIQNLQGRISSLEREKRDVSNAAIKNIERAEELDAREADLVAREQSVTGAEQQQAASEIRNGVHVVGQTVAAGVYSTAGPSGSNPIGCYYAWKSSTGSDATIVDNNITSGTATVTLVDGEIFESSSCQPWQKVG